MGCQVGVCFDCGLKSLKVAVPTLVLEEGGLDLSSRVHSRPMRIEGVDQIESILISSREAENIFKVGFDPNRVQH